MPSDSLRFVNALVGFCTMSASWPHPLADLGYAACGVEREITVDLGGQNRKVVVDLICTSAALNHSLCSETKSLLIKPDQARRYRAMKSSDLVNMANLPPGIEFALLTHDILYVCPAAHAMEVAAKLGESSNPFPVLGGDESEFRLASGKVSQEELHHVLATGIVIGALDEWPLTYVPFTRLSTDSEIVRYIARAMSMFIIAGTEFTSESVANRAISTWSWFGAEEKRGLQKRFSKLIDNARQHELSEYLERPESDQRWIPKRGQLSAASQIQRYNEQVNDFVE